MASNYPNIDLEDSSWQIDVQKNLTILTKSITDLDSVLIKLLEHNLISDNEYEIIRTQETATTKNLKLLFTLKAKGWSRIKSTFMQILKETRNDYCVQIIESSSTQQSHLFSQSQPKKEDISSNKTFLERLRKSNWWPKKKLLPNAFIKQPSSTEQLHCSSLPQTKKEDIISNESILQRLIESKWWPEKKILPNSFYERKTEKELFTLKLKNLLTQNENKNKTTVINQKVAVSGLGGVGKSTTAKWFGHQYENDYEIILWIDCGEGSLIKSFTNLARELNVKDRKELELKDLARGCFDILVKRNCLLIYDNAECYVGVDGIRDVLPKFHHHFHIIITSRNREWGNVTGYGRIPEFQMDVFDKLEALEFMRNNLDSGINQDESQMQIICELLGNLPLALQIAVATVNQSQILLNQYIENIKNTKDVFVTTFDDYEKTINKTMQISLDIIQNHEKDIGGLAYQILLIFGFITPDDVVLSFFEAVKKKSSELEIFRAAKLLECYSLVTHKSMPRHMKRKDTLSIHRLLQQVIRHNSSDSKAEILKQILHCEGFLENKLIPFSYAGEDLKHEFPQIKAELVDKLELKMLLRERKFQEAVELSRLIKEKLGNLTSDYNYALCLKYNYDTKMSIQVFEGLSQKVALTNRSISYDEYFSQSGIVEGSYLSLAVVQGQLFLLYGDERFDEKSQKLWRGFKQLIFALAEIDNILSMLNSAASSLFSFYTLQYFGARNYISLIKDNHPKIKHVKLFNCNLDEHFQLRQLPDDLEELTLHSVQLSVDGDRCTVKILNLITTHFVRDIQLFTVVYMNVKESKINLNILPDSLQKLHLLDCTLANDSQFSLGLVNILPNLQEIIFFDVGHQSIQNEAGFVVQFNISRLLSPKLNLLKIYNFGINREHQKLCIPLNRLKAIKELYLQHCKIVISDEFRIAPQSMSLLLVDVVNEHDVAFCDKCVTDFIEFNHMQKLVLLGMAKKGINWCGPLTKRIVNLEGSERNVNSQNRNFNIQNLVLHMIDFLEQTELKIKYLTMHESSVDISVLSNSIESLVLNHCTVVDSTLSSAKRMKFLDHLHQLTLYRVKLKDSSGNTMKDFDVSLALPHSLTQLRIDCEFSTRFSVYLRDLPSIYYLHLSNCNMILFPNMLITPKILRLRHIDVIDVNKKSVNHIPVNEFVGFKEMEELGLEGMCVDFSESVKISEVDLLFTKLLNWENGKWCIEYLKIFPSPGPTNMAIEYMQSKY